MAALDYLHPFCTNSKPETEQSGAEGVIHERPLQFPEG
jgi:hypothetical protein